VLAVSPDVLDDLNGAATRRWRDLDPMLPAILKIPKTPKPRDLPDGCMAPLVVTGPDGRPAGLGICRHQRIPDDALEQATMFVGPHERGGGLGAALVARAHAELDARGITTTLLHHAQVNPLSAPFWNRMGYRPLWTGWERRPAGALR
jgi:GNAT superfamily N-acetyltransferase